MTFSPNSDRREIPAPWLWSLRKWVTDLHTPFITCILVKNERSASAARLHPLLVVDESSSTAAAVGRSRGVVVTRLRVVRTSDPGPGVALSFAKASCNHQLPTVNLCTPVIIGV